MMTNSHPLNLRSCSEPDRSSAAAQVWHALGRRLAPSQGARRLKVQHLVLSQDDVAVVAAALQAAGQQIGVELELDSRDGELVLLDRDLADQMSPQLIEAFREGRPCLLVDGLRAGIPQRQALRRQIRQQLVALPLLWPLPAPASLPCGAAADSAFDTLWPLEPDTNERADAAVQLLQQLHKRQRDAAAAPLCASYGQGADLHFDFSAAEVRGNARAMQMLRLQHGLPLLVPHPTLDVHAQADADSLPLRQALWDLGAAAGGLPMMAAPADWWHRPLQGQGASSASEFTRVPRFLDVLRRLDSGPVTAAELRREGRIGATDLRRVMQACLLLGLARWCPAISQPKLEIPLASTES